jgi:hypothetical protein
MLGFGSLPQQRVPQSLFSNWAKLQHSRLAAAFSSTLYTNTASAFTRLAQENLEIFWW